MATITSRNQGRWDLLPGKILPLHLLCMRSPSLSLHSCNLPPLFYKRDGRGPFYGADSSLLLLSPLGRSFFLSLFFFNLEPDLALTLQRLGIELPLSPICTPYYKSAQITQQSELDVGCYSPEARTSINPCVPPFAQPFEARHAIRYKFTVGGREPR